MTAFLYMGVGPLVAMLVAAACVAVRAVEEDHLLVLGPRGEMPWIFERTEGGRYVRLAPAAVPGALGRYVWRTLYPRPSPVRSCGGGAVRR
jgi:hypothetical protein